MKLGVNIDHVATLRQARRVVYPDPVVGALLAEHAGCHSIVAHLREDRRHINDRDVRLLASSLSIPFNLEMSIHKDIVAVALKIKPQKVTLVPEKRQELTTEGGLDLVRHQRRIAGALDKLTGAGIEASLFIDPVKREIDKAKSLGVGTIELNTGKYSESRTPSDRGKELKKISQAARYAADKGLFVAAGHGLEYDNVKPILTVGEIEELNIGHAIVSRGVFIGLVAAVGEMLGIINGK